MIPENRFDGGAGTIFNAFITTGTFFRIFMNCKDACMLKYPGDKTCRANKMTKGPEVNETGPYNKGYDDNKVGVKMPMEEFKGIKKIININSEHKEINKKEHKKRKPHCITSHKREFNLF